MKEKCIGCGVEIQTKEPNQQGYIKKEVYLQRQDNFYCQRCFTLKHYNRDTKYPLTSNKYQDIIDEIKTNPGLIVNILDLFDLSGTIIPNINQLFSTTNILLVLNKVDLYLNSINKTKIYQYIHETLQEQGITVKGVFVMSSFRNQDITDLISKIEEMRNHRNVYFVGVTNVGKSTIINAIIKQFTEVENLITVSNTINTTLDSIYIPLDDKTYIVDTPGIINKKSLIYYLDKKSLDYITPKSYIRPKTFQLNPQQTLFILGLVRIDFVEGTRSSFVANFKNDLTIHRTKLENADGFYQNHKDDILIIPSPEERKKLGVFKKDVIRFDLNQKIDIAICGIGFVSVYGEGLVEITSFEKIKITIRKAII